MLSRCPTECHQDATYDSGPEIIKRHLNEEDKARYLNSRFRFRIVKWVPPDAMIYARLMVMFQYMETDD